MDSKANADVRKMAVRANRSSVSLNTDQLYEPFPYARSNAVAKSALNVTKPSDPDPAPPALPPANHKGGATRLPVQLGCVTSKLPSVSMLSCDCPAVMSTSAAATANQFSLYTDRMTHQMLTSQSIGSHSSGDQSTDQLLTPALYLRERWLNRLQFLCTCVGHSTALGNLWRFPWMCYRHGGGSFVFAYLITAFSVAMPLLMIELSLGQYAAMNPIHLFQHLTPILQGMGLASVIITIVVSFYMNVITSWSLVYLFESFGKLKWSTCDSKYSSTNCSTLNEATTFMNASIPGAILSSEDFFNSFVTRRSVGLEQVNAMNWYLVVSLASVSIILIAILIKGIHSFGRIVYVTSTIPLLVMMSIFIRCVSLDGASEGIRLFLQPDSDKLHDTSLWKDAAVQVFFSFVISNGVSITFASYNKFKYQIIRHTILIGLLNVFTSILIGLCVFATLGVISFQVNKPIFELLRSSLSIAFVAIPQALAFLPYASFWSIPYFISLVISGLHTQFAHIQVTLGCVLDSLRERGHKPNKPLIVITTVFITFLLGIPLCSDAGVYGIELIDHYISSIPFLFIALCEILIISYAYGIGHFFQDLRRMCCWCPPTLCKSHLIVFISSVCPFLICSLLYIHSADLLYPLRSSMYPPYMYPLWSMYLGYTIICLPLLCFPLAAVHYLLLQPIPSAQYHIPNRSLAIPLTQNQKRSGPLMTFLDKLQHSFRPTFTYRANELRYTGYGQRCNKSFGTSAGLLHAGLVSHCSNENQRLQSNHRSLPITSTLCCPLGAGNINSVNSALTTNGPVCFSSSLPATNPYSSSICPCSASTVAAISDPKCRIRCECVRLLPGECNQTFVQEF